ncbi:MAG: NADH-quinone oxidoreductase subunit H [Candidatus Aenigmarchaeota archaeon]|nr:NADH-quinone oxidoreductase subunit H [Candidatus Aenigmarchaeota archaeon]
MISELLHALVFPGLVSAIIFGFLYEGILRKVTAHMHSRIGPPVWQPFLDFVKLMSKENITTKDSFGMIMTFAPIISFASALTVLLFLPVGGFSFLSFGGDLFIVIYMLIMAGLFFAIGGFATGNPFASVGSVREIIQIFAIEFPFVISMITVGLMMNFSVSPFFAWQFPFALFSFLVSVQGKLSLPPFHIQEAEQEIVAGPLTEYSGPRLAMHELAKGVMVWTMISMGAVLFLGATNLLMFAVNSLALLFLLIVVRTIFGRLRIKQSLRLLWYVVGPLALIDLARVLLGIYI